MVETFGQEAIRFEVSWNSTEPASTSAEFTRARVRVLVDGKPVWHGRSDAEGFEWTWIELAEQLAHSWPWLTLDEGFPFDSRGGTLAELRAEFARLWDSKSAPAREQEKEQLYAYEESHDLARSLQGALTPPLWLAREGTLFWVATESNYAVGAAEQVLDTLEALVEAIISRASMAEDDRSKALSEAWDLRYAISQAATLEIITGLDNEVRAGVEGGLDPLAFWDMGGGEILANELTATARMSAAFPAEDVRLLIEAVRETALIDRRELNSLSGAVVAELPEGTPYDQGYTAAVWMREQLGLSVEDRIDPEDVCRSWGIPVKDIVLGVSTVDAIACWGPERGPAIYINDSGRRTQSAGSRRATLSHEICHLLIDRDGALPLVEVLGGRTPARIEERARAFAAELLAPREAVGREFASSRDPLQTLKLLQRRYIVGPELIAWQARNSAVILSPEDRAFLRSQVSQPWRF